MGHSRTGMAVACSRPVVVCMGLVVELAPNKSLKTYSSRNWRTGPSSRSSIRNQDSLFFAVVLVSPMIIPLELWLQP